MEFKKFLLMPRRCGRLQMQREMRKQELITQIMMVSNVGYERIAELQNDYGHIIDYCGYLHRLFGWLTAGYDFDVSVELAKTFTSEIFSAEQIP